MKKFLFLLCSLLATVGAWATDINVSLSTGTFHNAQSGAIAVPVEGTKYVYAWQSPADPAPQLTLYCPSGKNNMVIDTDVRLATDNYYLVVPAGYLIKSYSFNAYTGAASASVTPEGQNAISISTDATAPTLVEVRGLSTSTAIFAVSAGNPWMYVTDFYVTVEEDPNYVPPVYVTALSDLSNNKAYVITNARGTWNVADGATAMTTATKANRDDVKQHIAIIQNGGKYYLYRVNAKQYMGYDDALGKFNSVLGDPQPVNITTTGNEKYPWFFMYDAAHNVNINGAGQVLIDDWTAIDAGNSNAIIEAADFDPTEALAAFGSDEPIYIETDVTNSFSALTKNTNWKTGAGGTAGYTATNFCPTVTTNAGQTVQVCEFYEANCNRTGDLLYQTVSGLAPGVYQIELYGAAAYTFGRGFPSTAFGEGTWTAGQSITENTGVTLYAETSEGTYGGEIPIYYATDFPDGAATVKLDNVVVGSNGQVKIGMSKTTTSTNWHVIQLKGVTAKVLASDLLAAAVAQAEAIDEASVPAAVYSEVQSAIADNNKTFTTAEEYEAAIAAVETAVAKAEKFASAKAYFDKMGAVLETTNVYTQEAYDAKYGTWLAAYEAGTLDDAVLSTLTADLAYSTGWHSTNNIDDILLSAWTIGGEQAHEFDKRLYINTWSVEGDNDGTEFRVPFYEYWTGDDNSLGANVIAATIEGLEAGATYEVNAWVRARAKNNVAAADATGITLTVGDGEAIDVTEGEAVGQFNLAQYKATGKADADGKLTITFNVAADNNVSWLSFQGVKYAKEAAEVDPYDAAMAAIKDGSYYTISTKVGDKDYYLTAEGTLTDDAYSATAFHFTAESPTKEFFKPTGWYLGVNFTNPSTEGNKADGQFLNEGAIRIYNSHRADYESEVFFYNGEAYAIRSTNKYKGADRASEWGANTFWTAIEGELPTAGYTLEQEYRWNLTEIANPELQDLRNEIVEAIAESQNTEGIGDYLFQKSAAGLKKLAEVAEAQKAVADNANATKEQIAAAQKALQDATLAATNLPEEGSKFTLQLKGYDIYASFNEQNKETGKGENLAGFSAEPVEFTWTSADAGNYYLTDGTNYLGFAHAWNVTYNEMNGAVSFEAVELEDGVYYYIHTPNNLLGASASKAEAGYRIFSDKSATDPTLWILSPNEAVVADPYEAALAAIEDGANYSIFTEVNGTKYYLKGDGTLTATKAEGAPFTFVAVNAANTLQPTGWNLGHRFTNPSLTNGSTGDVVNDGHIHVGGNDRNDWERQVFYKQGGKFAVRATNANSANWGANTYWDVFENELPEAGYSLEPAYVWQLEENAIVDVACNLVQDGKVTATVETKQPAGFAPIVPAAWNDQFHGLYAFTPDVKVVAENTTAVNFTPEWAGPFQFSTDEVTNWYNMDIRSGWQVAKQETEPYTMKQNATAEEKATPEFQWAFLPVEGEPCQVIVLNRAAKGQSLTKVEAADAGKFDVVMRDGEYKWEIFANGNGFVLREIGSENMWVNQDGGGKPESPLRFWNNALGKTDGGSTFRVEFVEAEENAPESTIYEGILVQTLYAPGGASVMGTTTTEHTVAVTPVDDYHVNVTVPAFQLPALPIGVKDVTFENVMAVKTGNMVRYIWEGDKVSVQNGMMVMNYNATFEGAQTSADATPVFHFTVGQAWNDDIYFGADEAAIEAYKNPVVEPEKESPYGFWGADVAATDVNGGDYYLYNIGTKQFLTGANSWGTQASRNDVGTRFTVAELEDGTFTLDSHISNGGNSHYLGNGGYVDAAPFGFTLTKVEDETEGVSIYTIGDGTNLYVANAENTIVEFKAADATDPMAQWMLVNKSERLKLLAKATPENPVDATFMILCSDFGRNDQYIGEWNGAPVRGGNNDNQCAEKWNTNFDIYQVVKWIPAGQYEVSVQGFYRAGYPDTNTDAQNAFLYANGVETPLMAITAEGQATQGGAYNTVSNGVYVPNSMNEASTIFTAGGYAQNKLITTVYDLTMTLGVKKSELIDGDWTIFDNFRIKYLGYDEPTTLAAAKKAYDAKVAEAKEIEATLSSDGIAIIDEALEANNDAAYTTSWEYAIAVNNIQDAITKATAAAKEDVPVATSIDGIMAGADNQNIYDLSGRKVAKVQKGIYIVNGKKVAVK